MKTIFISHPLSGDLKNNRKKADKICKDILKQGYLPISPAHMFLYIDKETNKTRETIMQVCYKLIELSDEVWVFGESEGCKKEEKYAQKKDKKVKLFYRNKKEE